MTEHQEPAAPTDPATASQAAANQATTPPEPAAQDPAARIAELEAALQEMKDKWLRSEAEMANLRARTKREV